jgi:gliding motility-associated-like protein
MKHLSLLVVFTVFIAACKKNSDDTDKVYTLPTECNHMISVRDSLDFYLPNAFTPNGDGRNDVYRLFGFLDQSYAHFRMSISRLNGQQVFETTNMTAGWNGKDFNGNIPTDYLYKVNIKGTSPSTLLIDSCTYVYMFSDTCVPQGIVDLTTLRFEDMFDPATGATPYLTGENICH